MSHMEDTNSKSTRVTISLPKHIRCRLREVARAENRTVSNYLQHTLQKLLEDQKSEEETHAPA